MSTDEKIEKILTAVTDLNTSFKVYQGQNDERVKANERDVSEIRRDLWGKDGIKDTVQSHSSSVSLLKWIGGIAGGASLAALVNSILHIVVK